MTNKISIAKRFVDNVPYPETGQELYFDASLKGFGLRVTAGGSKAYFVQARVGGKSFRKTIGKHGPFSPESARKEAKQALAAMANGQSPKAKEAANRAGTITLGDVFEEYKSTRQLRPRTVQEYTNNLERCVSDWLKKPITQLTREQIEKRLMHIATANGPRGEGKAQAGQTYRLLRSLFRFAIEQYDTEAGPLFTSDPTRNLSRNRPWTENTRRQSCIQKHQLTSWFKAIKILGESNSTNSDYFVFLLLTGLRRSEAESLTWENVDLKGKSLKINASTAKNHEEHRLPLSDYLEQMLRRRQSANELRSPYVFSSSKSASGHIEEIKASQKKVIELSKVQFMAHDLRRTFITVAEIIDIPHYTLKALLNHKSDSSDVTSGYIVTTLDRLRQPMQRITDYILEKGGIKRAKAITAKPNVINMRKIAR